MDSSCLRRLWISTALLAGCAGEVVVAEEVGEVRSALIDGYTLDGCSSAETSKIHEAIGHLLLLITDDVAFQNLAACVRDAPLIWNHGFCSEQLVALMRNSEVTQIRCASLDPNVAGQAQLDIEAQRITLDHSYIQSASFKRLAGVIAHELMHNYGFDHPESGEPMYSNTVPEQVQSCVVTTTATKIGTSNAWASGGTHANSCALQVFSEWVDISDSVATKPQLKLGDFDGDSMWDVLWANGTEWRIKYSGTGPWVSVGASTAPASQLLIGDFGGTEADDVLWADGTQWRIKYSAKGGWNVVSNSSAPADQLQSGDFNKDERADILWADGAQWRVKYAAAGSWISLGTSNAPASQLLVGNFGGDAASDVLWANGSSWRIKYAGAGAWNNASTSTLAASQLLVGDFGGDGFDDVMHTDGSRWRVKASALGGWTEVSLSSVTSEQLLIGHFKHYRNPGVLIGRGSHVLRTTGSGWQARYLVDPE